LQRHFGLLAFYMSVRSLTRSISATAAQHRLSLASIRRATTLIDRRFLNTPQFESQPLSARLGCDLVLKDETSNPVGCFKGRGAEYLLAQVLERNELRPLVCASAGNFGLGMAHACARRGVQLTVFVAEQANPVKVEGIRERGAHIMISGSDFDSAKLAASSYACEHNAVYIEDGMEPAIAEGAGTIAIELLQSERYDAIVVPLGNGALLAGIARWTKAHATHTQIIGVCSAGAPVMANWWKHRNAALCAGARADTIADGIAVRVPVPAALDDLQPVVDDIVLVDDRQHIAAMRMLHEETALQCEPSAVAGIAAIAADRQRFAGRRMATILTGRNLTQEQSYAWFG
jgi:threonine dehydratase